VPQIQGVDLVSLAIADVNECGDGARKSNTVCSFISSLIPMHELIKPMLVEQVLFPWVEWCKGETASLNYFEIKNNELSLVYESVILIGTFIIKNTDEEIIQGFYAEILFQNLVFQKIIHEEAFNGLNDFIVLSILHNRKLIDIIEKFKFSKLKV